VVEVAMRQIFNYFVCSAIEVSQIAATVRFTIEGLEQIVVQHHPLQHLRPLSHNSVLELRKRDSGVAIVPPIQMDVVIYTEHG
jgi:hypothetical protein